MKNHKKLTQNEYKTFIGLSHFLMADQAENSNVKLNTYDVNDFCFKANDLFGALDEFFVGRFKCDGGLSCLTKVFNDAMTANPHMTNQYFYVYSQLMELLASIYNAEPFIMHFSDVFYKLSNKIEFFEMDDNQTVTI